MSRWYVWTVPEGGEERAHKALEGAGIRSLFVHEPLPRLYDRKRGRMEIDRDAKRVALFPAYALAFLESGQITTWVSKIRRITYLSSKFGTYRSIVTDLRGPLARGDGHDEIERLRNISATVASPRRPRFEPGDSARVTRGAFEAQKAIVLEVITGDRARVVIGSLSVNVRLEDLEKTG